MALTAAERKKIYLEKLKANGQYEAFKKKKAADERNRQQRIKDGLAHELAQLPKAVREKTNRLNRENNRKKAAVCRRRKRENLGLSDRNAVDSQHKNLPNSSKHHVTVNLVSCNDEILFVNGKSLQGMKHDEAINEFKSIKIGDVEILIGRRAPKIRKAADSIDIATTENGSADK